MSSLRVPTHQARTAGAPAKGPEPPTLTYRSPGKAARTPVCLEAFGHNAIRFDRLEILARRVPSWALGYYGMIYPVTVIVRSVPRSKAPGLAFDKAFGKMPGPVFLKCKGMLSLLRPSGPGAIFVAVFCLFSQALIAAL